MVDAGDLKSPGATRASSILAPGTSWKWQTRFDFEGSQDAASDRSARDLCSTCTVAPLDMTHAVDRAADQLGIAFKKNHGER